MQRVDAGNGSHIAWIAVLALFAVLNVARLTQSSMGHDFFQFWSYGQYLASTPAVDPYAKTTAREVAQDGAARVAEQRSQRGIRAAQTNRQLYANGVEPISTPFYYAAFASLTGGHFDADLLSFQWISSAALLVAGWFACRTLGYPPLANALALTVLALIFGPLHADIETGNSNRLQLAMLAAAIALHHRAPRGVGAWVGGAVLGICVALKPNLAAVPLFLAIVWALDRRFGELFHAALGWMLGIGFACAVAVQSLSWSAWPAWFSALAGYGSHPAGIAQTNWSSARLILEWTGANATPALAALLIGSLAIVAWRSRSHAAPEIGRDFVALSAAAVFPLIVSPIAWDHYFLLAAPAILLLLRPAAGSAARRFGGVVVLTLCAINPLRVGLPSIGAQGLAVGLSVATALIWILLLRELTTAPRPQTD